MILTRGFPMPGRLTRFTTASVRTANQWHFAMLNDVERADAYRRAMATHIVHNKTTVLEIGAGSGLLSMLAATLGARQVWAIEGNPDFAGIARSIIDANGLASRIRVIDAVSTEVQLGTGPASLPERPDLLVAELLGTTLDGESQLDYVNDVRRRLCRADTIVLPTAGAQFVSLMESPALASLTSVHTSASHYLGLNLSGFNALRDTATTSLSRPLGVRLNDLGVRRLAPRLRILEVDFTRPAREAYRARGHGAAYRVRAERAGRLHAAVFSWEAYLDVARGVTLSTHPEHTRNNTPRDVAWGHAVQLLEDAERNTAYIAVKAGELLRVNVYFGNFSAAMPAVTVARVPEERANWGV